MDYIPVLGIFVILVIGYLFLSGINKRDAHARTVMQDCDRCNGDGLITCKACDTNGCPRCSRSGKIDCVKCEGQGRYLTKHYIID
jgi:hypothetical protein